MTTKRSMIVAGVLALATRARADDHATLATQHIERASALHKAGQLVDALAELSAIVTLAGADVWVGIDDTTAEGSYVNVLGIPQSFLPWAPGEPDNNGNQDCVAVRAASSKLESQTCGAQRIAVCECVP